MLLSPSFQSMERWEWYPPCEIAEKMKYGWRNQSRAYHLSPKDIECEAWSLRVLRNHKILKHHRAFQSRHTNTKELCPYCVIFMYPSPQHGQRACNLWLSCVHVCVCACVHVCGFLSDGLTPSMWVGSTDLLALVFPACFQELLLRYSRPETYLAVRCTFQGIYAFPSPTKLGEPYTEGTKENEVVCVCMMTQLNSYNIRYLENL